MIEAEANLSEFDFAEIESETNAILRTLDEQPAAKVIVDFHRTAYFGSAGLNALVRIGRKVREQGGQMELCNLTKCELKVLEITHMERLWHIRPSQTFAPAREESQTDTAT